MENCFIDDVTACVLEQLFLWKTVLLENCFNIECVCMRQRYQRTAVTDESRRYDTGMYSACNINGFALWQMEYASTLL